MVTFYRTSENDISLGNFKLAGRFGYMFKRYTVPMLFKLNNERKLWHMMFVFHKLDIIFLDNKFNIIEVKENMRPFNFYLQKQKAYTAIEIDKNIGRIGEKVIFWL